MDWKLKSAIALGAASVAVLGAGQLSTDSDASAAELLRRGDQGQEVRAIQDALRQRGFLSASTTGFYGGQTETAVRDFQKANGLTADGVVGPKTRALLLGSGDRAPASNAATSAAATSLRAGQQGEAVESLQQALKSLGYYNYSVTGYYGPMTTDAVKAFQRTNGLSVDGIAGTKTITKLNSGSAAVVGSGDIGRTESSTSILRLGIKSNAVTAMQQRLRSLGYLSSPATGYFGSATRSAVIAFQLANGLSADGIAGTKTLAVLNSGAAKPATTNGGGADVPSENASSRPTADGASVSAFLSAAKQHLGSRYVWGGSGPNTFDCSGFVYHSLREAGVVVDRLSAAGYSQSSSWQTIGSIDALQPGDLLFWRTDRASIGHAGIYLGDGQFIHASSSQGKVVISSIHTSYWTNNFVRAKRLY